MLCSYMGETMSKIIYHTGSIFNAPNEKTILIHSCNAMGNWGAGIALAFRELFPLAYRDYQAKCLENTPEELMGTALQWHRMHQQSVGSLFTSRHFKPADNQYHILVNTKRSLTHLLNNMPPGYEIHAPKINSGLFRVPWERTEWVMEGVLKTFDVSLHVWEGNSKTHESHPD